MSTLVIDVINKTIPVGYHQNIPIINEPNPCYGYTATSDQIKQLLQMPNYYIYEAGTDKLIDGTNYYDYFPEEGGGGGGGVTIDTLWSDSNGATVGTEYTMNGSIDDYDVVYVKSGDVKDISTDNSYIQSSFLPSLIKDSEHLTLECFYHQRFMQINFNADKFTVVKAGAYGEKSEYTPILWQIVGIKY